MTPFFGATFAKGMKFCVKVHASLQFLKESYLVEMFPAFSNFNRVMPSNTVILFIYLFKSLFTVGINDNQI